MSAEEPPRWAVWVARAVAVVVVVPVRLAWESVKVVGRAAGRPLAVVLRWVGSALRAVGGAASRWVFRPVGAVLRWFGGLLLRYLLRPAGMAVRWFGGVLARYVLRPLGAVLRWADRGLRALGELLWRAFERPLRWLWRAVVVRGAGALWRALRVFADAVGWAFRLVGRGSAVVGAAVARVFRLLVVVPARWAHQVVVAPVGRVVARVWRAVVVAPARWVRATVVEPVRLAGRRVLGVFRGR
ncbi:hypothetical protein ACIGNX_21885 [Actinosynnema sp. NPDC053489]|uniref:hypothetical protein n=1 Tax=Actinosynnema sp. NPDC053489 TaxID=3363916 RepID=UPI0037C6CD3E